MGDDRDDIQRLGPSGAPEVADDRADLWRDEHLSAEILSEYLDEPHSFGPRDRAAIDTHLAGCDACRGVLDDLHSLVTALAALPEPVPARSFRLTPEMLEERDLPRSLDAERRPIDIQRTSAWRRRQIAAVRYATATAAVLLVLVLGADLISNSGGSRGSDDDSEAAPSSIQQSFATDAAPTEDAQRNSITPVTGEADLVQATAAFGAAPTATTAGAAPEQDVSTAGTAAEPTATAAAATGGASEATPTEESLALSEAPPEAPADDLAAERSALEDSDDGEESSSSSRSGWRTLEFGLVLLLAWLLALLVILPHLGRRGARRE